MKSCPRQGEQESKKTLAGKNMWSFLFSPLLCGLFYVPLKLPEPPFSGEVVFSEGLLWCWLGQ